MEHHLKKEKEGDEMKIGFIGAGKVGVSLGKYFADHGSEVAGYYDCSEEASKEAALFTDSRHYKELLPIVEDSDALFLTVPDGMIHNVWEEIRSLPVKGHIICHCSGALTARGHFRVFLIRAVMAVPFILCSQSATNIIPIKNKQMHILLWKVIHMLSRR